MASNFETTNDYVPAHVQQCISITTSPSSLPSATQHAQQLSQPTTMASNSDTTNEYVPAHIQQWVCEMQEKISSRCMEEVTPPPSAHTETAMVCHNAIKAEVIEGGRRCTRVVSKSSSDDEDESQAFGRHMYVNKKAHRVACLLASARLLASFSNQAADTAE
eukprot:3262269-Rhodomonas_salina.1